MGKLAKVRNIQFIPDPFFVLVEQRGVFVFFINNAQNSVLQYVKTNLNAFSFANMVNLRFWHGDCSCMG
jgi:hypothetical protein